jgi:hypothetical protein
VRRFSITTHAAVAAGLLTGERTQRQVDPAEDHQHAEWRDRRAHQAARRVAA